MSAIRIKRIVFKLNRRFKWEDKFDKQVREAVALGLAVLPEAIKIGEQEVEEMEQSTSTATTTLATSQRRLSGGHGDEKHHEELNQFRVQITKPMNYELDHKFVQGLVKMGAFRDLDDGREHTHGRVFIQDFELHDAPGDVALADATGRAAKMRVSAGIGGREGNVVAHALTACGVVVGVAMIVSLGVVALKAIGFQWRQYTAVAATDSVASANEQLHDDVA